MVKNYWTLVLLCSTGWLLIALGVLLKIPPLFQILMLSIGMILSIVSVFGLAKQLFSGKK